MNWEKLQFLITCVMFAATLIGFLAIIFTWVSA
jgi:hypothetical protein